MQPKDNSFEQLADTERLFLKYTLAILIFFVITDSIRDTFIENAAAGLIRDLMPPLCMALHFSIFLNNRVKLKWGTFTFIFLPLIILLALLIINASFHDAYSVTDMASELHHGSIGVISKFVALISMTYLLTRFRMIVCKDSSIECYFITMFTLYAAITLILLIYDSEGIINDKWAGRYSIGYPTLDSFIACVSIAFAISYLRSIVWKVFAVTLAVVFLLLQNTVTGFISLVLLFISYGCFARTFLLKTVLFASAAFIPLAIFFIYSNQALFPQEFSSLVVSKVNNLILMTGNDSSFALRYAQAHDVISLMFRDWLNILYGGGPIGIFAVENGYIGAIASFGAVGIMVLTIAVIYTLTKMSSAQANSRRCGCVVFLLLLVAFFSLSGFYLYAIIFVLSYFFSEASRGHQCFSTSR